MTNNKIFISIASYRDKQLIPTIEDCIKKAKNPENLVFAIGWQHEDDENLDDYINRSNFRILSYHSSQSKGVNWMRYKLQQLWDGEDYYFQLDSHHRFIKNWDVELIDMYKKFKYKKSIITTYGTVFNPEENTFSEDFQKIAPKHFFGQGIFYIPHYLPKDLKRPVRARFISGHFIFTHGRFCKDVQYDPYLYFHGEETNLSVRSFTKGYNIYHPHKNIQWHEYIRNDKTKHWDEHSSWSDHEKKTVKRIEQLLRQEDHGIDLGEFDLGDERTLEEYEKYANVNFKDKVIGPDAEKALEPPEPRKLDDLEVPELIDIPLKKFKYVVKWPRSIVNNSEDDILSISVIVDGVMNETLFRKDITPDSDPEYFTRDAKNDVIVEVEAREEPTKFIIWPYSESKGWIDKLEIANITT